LSPHQFHHPGVHQVGDQVGVPHVGDPPPAAPHVTGQAVGQAVTHHQPFSHPVGHVGKISSGQPSASSRPFLFSGIQGHAS